MVNNNGDRRSANRRIRGGSTNYVYDERRGGLTETGYHDKRGRRVSDVDIPDLASEATQAQIDAFEAHRTALDGSVDLDDSAYDAAWRRMQKYDRTRPGHPDPMPKPSIVGLRDLAVRVGALEHMAGEIGDLKQSNREYFQRHNDADTYFGELTGRIETLEVQGEYWPAKISALTQELRNGLDTHEARLNLWEAHLHGLDEKQIDIRADAALHRQTVDDRLDAIEEEHRRVLLMFFRGGVNGN
jgi:hypothetical protein